MINRLAQLLEVIKSLCQLTVTAPPQLSLVVTLLVSGAGTRLAQLTVRLVVQVMLGGLVSWTVMVWAQVALLPHRSVAPRSEERRVGKERRPGLIESPCQLTVTALAQLSLVVARLVAGSSTRLV